MNTTKSLSLSKLKSAALGMAGVLALSAATAAPPVLAQNAPATHVKIASQPLGLALRAIGEQTGMQIVLYADDATGMTAPALDGVYTTRQALDAVLRGSGLIHRPVNDRTIAVAPPARFSSNTAAGMQSVRVVQRAAPQAVDAMDTDDRRRLRAREDDSDEITLEEMVVTGTNIRGAVTASPVAVFDRQAIELTGRSTLPDFLRTVPQVFGGGASDANAGISSANDAGLNVGSGAGVNLRGLGTDSTLVLLNGRRMAAAGFGEFVDVSMIPLTAVDRVEVLTDGASAIYGSDAVSGVVNFILRDGFDGAETRVRYGTVTEGDSFDVQVGHVQGAEWGSGHGLISYEFRRRTALDSEDRSFTRDSNDPTDLFPNQTQHSLFTNLGQSLTEDIELFATAFYTSREADRFQGSTFSDQTFLAASRTEQVGATAGGTVALGGDWQAELAGTYNRVKIDRQSSTFDLPLTGRSVPVQRGEALNDSRVLIAEARADGSLFRLPGGDVWAAFGGQYRREDFDVIPGSGIVQASDRNVFAAYGEVVVPLVGEDNALPGVEVLQVTAAGRYERYNDFGSSTDPKVGVLWSPVGGLNLRATFGTSFRAPLLRELDENNRQAFMLDVPDPDAPGGVIPGILIAGNSADLEPETATSWTAGVDWTPEAIPGLSATVTYFTIDFDNRIAFPWAFIDGFTDPRFAPLVTRNPDPAFVASLASLEFFENFSSFDPSETEIIFDRRLNNLASVETSGLDVSLSYGLDTDIGTWTVSLESTHLFELAEQLISTAAPVDVVDTVNNPADFRLNGSVGWSLDGITANLRVNHTGGYRDVRADPAVGVDAWTTVDLFLSFDTGGWTDSPWLAETVFSLSIQNLLDQDPPFAAGISDAGRNFDPDNATALGRFIAVQATRRW